MYRFLILFILLSGCTNIIEIRRPGGVVEYAINCSGAGAWRSCYEKANKICPDGYNTLYQNGAFAGGDLHINCPSKRWR